MSQTSRHRSWVLLGLGLILGLHLLHLRHYFFLTDDAFISFRYLHNWIVGRGLVFNPGERVEGYTNFLWIALLAPFALLHLAPEKVAPVFSIFASLVLLGLVFCFPRLARREKQLQPGWLLAPLFLALHRSYAVWATSGLETRLFTLLIFLGAIFAWRAGQNGNRRDPLWAGLFFALAELCRPEAALFFLVAGGLVLGLRRLAPRPRLAWRDLGGILVFGAVILAHYGGRRWYYGLWLPNTFYAKAREPWWDMGLYYLGMFILEYSYWLWLPLLVAYAGNSLRRRDPLPAFLALLALPYLAYLVYLGGDHFEYRFLDPVLPFLALLLQECLRRLARTGRSRLRRPLLAGFTLVFLTYATALPWFSGLGFGTEYQAAKTPPLDLNQAPLLEALPGFFWLTWVYKAGYHAMIQFFVGVRAEEHRLFWLQQEEHSRRFQEFLRRGWLAPDEVIAIGSVGILPYHTGLRTVDFFGLTDPVIARMKNRRPVRAMFHDKIPSPGYLQDRQVDYVFLGKYLYPARPDHVLPTLTLKYRLDLKSWVDRFYLLELGSWLLLFESPRDPAELLARFQERRVPIWLYLPEGPKARPTPLPQALARFPELNR